MEGTVGGIETMLDIGRRFYDHTRTVSLGIITAAALFYVAGCTNGNPPKDHRNPDCEEAAQRIRTEYRLTGKTTPLPSGSECHRYVNEHAYERIRAWSKQKKRNKARLDNHYLRVCQPPISSRGLEEECEEWKENQ